MNTPLCDETINQFVGHLQTGFESYDLEDRCLIVTPFLYPDFASIEYSIQPVGDGYLLSDNGETLNMLFLNGLTVESNRDLWKQVSQIATNHGAVLDRTGISVIANENNLGGASQNLLNAIQAIGYMIYRRRNVSFVTFDDEVEKLLISNEVKYEPHYMIRGEAIQQHKVKFHVNSNRNLLIEPLTASNYQSARSKAIKTVFKWIDIGKVNPSLKFVTVIDDRDKKWETVWNDDEARSTVLTYSTEVIRWTAEQDKLIHLVASLYISRLPPTFFNASTALCASVILRRL